MAAIAWGEKMERRRLRALVEHSNLVLHTPYSAMDVLAFLFLFLFLIHGPQ